MTATTPGPTAAEASGYTSVAVALHWLIAVMILGQIAGGVYMSGLPLGSEKFQLYQMHKSFGITVLLLSLARLGWRLTHPAPPLPVDMKDWERRVARVSHIAFYALMIGVPLGGWAVVSSSPLADSVPTKLFGVIPWPHLPFFSGVADRETLSESIAGMHEFFAFATLALMALHVCAALRHHFVQKDAVLTRMIPFLRPRG
ncbi:MAG: cytochrome b [Pseudomonadota bacterium]